MRRRGIAMAAFGICLCIGGAAAAAIRYEATVLGGGVATGINNHGEAVGSYYEDAYYRSEQTGWSRVGPTVYANYGTDINDSGWMTGYTVTTTGYGKYVWYSGWVYHPASGTYGTSGVDCVMGINEHGATAGSEYVTTWPNGTVYNAAAYYPGVGVRTFGASRTSAQAINDRGVAVGSSGGRAIVYDGAAGSYLPGLGSDDNGGAMDLNDRWHPAPGGHPLGRVVG